MVTVHGPPRSTSECSLLLHHACVNRAYNNKVLNFKQPIGKVCNCLQATISNCHAAAHVIMPRCTCAARIYCACVFVTQLSAPSVVLAIMFSQI